MNKAFNPPAVLRWLAERISQPQWYAASTFLVGRIDPRALRACNFVSGATVALTLERPPQLAAEACLLLAATPEACDDALYLAEGRMWLLRRYAPTITETELDLLFKQQQVLATLLATTHCVEATPSKVAGRFA